MAGNKYLLGDEGYDRFLLREDSAQQKPKPKDQSFKVEFLSLHCRDDGHHSFARLVDDRWPDQLTFSSADCGDQFADDFALLEGLHADGLILPE